MQCLTCEECDFICTLKKTTSITNIPRAVTFMFETCDEWDPIFRWEDCYLGRI